MDKDAAWIGKGIGGMERLHEGWKAVHKKCTLNGTRIILMNVMEKDWVVYSLFLKPHWSNYNEKRYKNHSDIKHKHHGQHA